MVVRLRRRNQARCTCGWIGKASLLLSSAKVDALLHAARTLRAWHPAVAAGGSCAHQVLGRPQGRQPDGPDARGLTRTARYLDARTSAGCSDRLQASRRGAVPNLVWPHGPDDGSRSTSTTILNRRAKRARICRFDEFPSGLPVPIPRRSKPLPAIAGPPVRVAREEPRVTVVKYCDTRTSPFV